MTERKIFIYERQWILIFLYMYNCGGHVNTPESKEAAAAINHKIRKLVANDTDLIQPLDFFSSQKPGMRGDQIGTSTIRNRQRGVFISG